ncbi:hypothetical protein ACFD8S_004535 [Escherichia coli]
MSISFKISCPFGLKKERSQSPFDETIMHLFRCIIKISGLKNGKLFDDCTLFIRASGWKGRTKKPGEHKSHIAPGRGNAATAIDRNLDHLPRPAKPD